MARNVRHRSETISIRFFAHGQNLPAQVRRTAKLSGLPSLSPGMIGAAVRLGRCFVQQLLKRLEHSLPFPHLSDRDVGICGIENNSFSLILSYVLPNLRTSDTWV